VVADRDRDRLEVVAAQLVRLLRAPPREVVVGVRGGEEGPLAVEGQCGGDGLDLGGEGRGKGQRAKGVWKGSGWSGEQQPWR